MRNVINSQIALTADVNEDSSVLNSIIGEYCIIGKNSRFMYSSIGDLSYISVNTYVFSSEIGKFTSISWNVSIGPAKHDFNRISSHSMLFAKRFNMIEKRYYNQYEGHTVIGNDVWIGCNSTIMRGVSIGDGAIIGSNSVITKDVAPYPIVVGVNRFLRWRFRKEIRERLLEIKWWNYPLSKIKANISILAEEPTLELLDNLEYKFKV